MYVLIPFGGPVHAEDAEIIPAGMLFFSTVLVCTGFGKSRFPRDFTEREQKTTGNQTFPRELFGREREIKISSGTVWTGTGNQDFFGNCLDGTTGTIFAREREKKPFPVQSRENFPAGIFPSKALQKTAS